MNVKVDTLFRITSKDPFNNPFRIHTTDSSLLICNGSGVKDTFFIIYNLNDESISAKLIKGGRQRGEALSVLSNGYNEKENYVWLHDVSAGKFLKASVPKSKKDTTTVLEYKMPAFFYSMKPYNNDKILATGHEDTSNSVLVVLNTKTGLIENRYGIYADKPDSISLQAWRLAKEGYLFVQKSENYAAVASRFTDIVEFFDLKSGKTTQFVGPDKFNPSFSILKSQGQDKIYRTEKSRDAYLDGYVTEKYLYLLYSGQLEKNPFKWSAKSIFIFDWKGTPIKRINIDRNVTCISVSPNDDWLYAFDPFTQYIVRAKL